MKKVKLTTAAIQDMALTAGIEDDSLGEIVTQQEIIDGKVITYKTFKVFSPNTEELFILGTMLGAHFGANSIWIDTYKATQKYLGYAKIEISVK